MALIRSFRDLETYKKAREQTRVLFEASQSFPREEKFSLTDQVRRSSRAVGAMIAEAWAKRRYPALFVNKIDDALGEAMETQPGSIARWTAVTSPSCSTEPLMRPGKASEPC